MANSDSVLYKNVDMRKVSTQYYLYRLPIGTYMLTIYNRNRDRIIRGLSVEKAKLFKQHMRYVGGGLYLRRKGGR